MIETVLQPASQSNFGWKMLGKNFEIYAPAETLEVTVQLLVEDAQQAPPQAAIAWRELSHSPTLCGRCLASVDDEYVCRSVHRVTVQLWVEDAWQVISAIMTIGLMSWSQSNFGWKMPGKLQLHCCILHFYRVTVQLCVEDAWQDLFGRLDKVLETSHSPTLGGRCLASM